MEFLEFKFRHFDWKGKTFPQIIFNDPDWFFYCYHRGDFNNNPSQKSQADFVYNRARNIKIPNNEHANLKAEYVFLKKNAKFIRLDIITNETTQVDESTLVICIKHIDMLVIMQSLRFNKVENSLKLKQIKYILFFSNNYSMTKNRSEKFFSNPDNFILPEVL